MTYVVYLLNHLSVPQLNNRTPLEKAFGVTLDVSALMQFHWYEPVLFYDKNQSFPHSRELPGHFVGIAEHCGDALTFQILTTDTRAVILRSVVRSAIDLQHPNLRNSHLPGGEPKPLIVSESDVIDPARLKLPQVNPEQLHALIGRHFVKDHQGGPYRAEVVELLDENKFKLKIGDEGHREEIIAYNDLMELIERDLSDMPDNGEKVYTFSSVTAHRRIARSPQQWEILVKWDTGEETWEPLQLMRTQDPVTIAAYAKAHDLLDTPGWKRLKHYIKTDKRFIRYLRQAKASMQRHAP